MRKLFDPKSTAATKLPSSILLIVLPVVFVMFMLIKDEP